MSFPYRRKREMKTDYRRRLKLLKSNLPRLVIRLSNKYVKVQIVEYQPDGDKIIAAVSSNVLKKLGWRYSCKNIPSCYLTGLMLAKKVKIKEELVPDLGLRQTIKGSRLYAVVKGVVDGGLKVKTSEEIFPSEERISGKHISENINKDFETIKTKVK